MLIALFIFVPIVTLTAPILTLISIIMIIINQIKNRKNIRQEEEEENKQIINEIFSHHNYPYYLYINRTDNSNYQSFETKPPHIYYYYDEAYLKKQVAEREKNIKKQIYAAENRSAANEII